ncbi:DUF6270 domain-containing protein [Azospirillum melinis]
MHQRRRIVLLRTSWTEVQRTPRGLAPLPDATVVIPGRMVSRQAHNERLERCHARFQTRFPEAVVVEAPPETHVADPDHIWGFCQPSRQD